VEFAICLEYAFADIGFENLCVKLHQDPRFVEEVLDRYTSYAINLIEIYNQMAEIDFIWIGDDLAYNAGPFFSPDMYRKHVFPFIEKAVRKIEKPWLYHSDGNIMPLLEDILSWGMQGLHPLEPGAMDIFQMKREIGDRVALVGNLSVDQISRAPQAKIATETERLLRGCSPGGGYGFSSGNAIPRYANTSNLLAISETLAKFNTQLAQ
jgi:uroporphyrinogen decarboxylase